MVKDWGNITFAEGYGDQEDVTDEALIAEAVEKAGKAKAAVIFAGLPDAFESEGFDRSHMGMPNCQNELINRVAAVQPVSYTHLDVYKRQAAVLYTQY